MTDFFPHSVVLNDAKYAAKWDTNREVILIAVGRNSLPLNPGDVVELLIDGNIKKFKITSPPILSGGAFAENGRRFRLKFNVSELRG